MSYRQYYQEFCNDVHKSFSTYLLWRMMQNRASEEPGLLKAFNDAPMGWTAVRHSLQVTLLMTLGRIFDTDGDAFSIDDLLRCCIDDLDLFSKGELRKRKIADCNGKRENWLDEYIEGAYEPNQKDFQKLRGEVSKFRRIFEKKYQPIRHKVFAHKDKEFLVDDSVLWSETKMSDIEGMLWFLDDLKDVLFQQYANGRKPDLTGDSPDLSFYEDDFTALLDRVRSAGNDV